MKKQLLVAFLIVSLLSFTAISQTIIKNAENVEWGTVLTYQNCQASELSSGNGGPNQVWDFSALKSKPNSILTITIDSVKSNIYGKYFPQANLVKMFSDDRFVFINKTSDASYLVGYVDTIFHTKTEYFNPQLLMKRQLKYGNVAVDTFFRKTTLKGYDKQKKKKDYVYYIHGMISLKADGYGQLKLPNGVSNNVVRVKVVQQVGDSMMNAGSLVNDVTSYIWYDPAHMGFLFRIDSSRSGSQNMISAQYLLNETNLRKRKK
jgi:hypothetical protein